MTQDQKFSEPLRNLDEELVIACLKQKDLQKIQDIIKRSPITPSGKKQITLSGGSKITVKPTINMLDLILLCNYLSALKVYIHEGLAGPRRDQRFGDSLNLYEAAWDDNQILIEFLLAAGSDHHFCIDQHGQNSLHIAANLGHAHLVELLVQSLKTPRSKEFNKEFNIVSHKKWRPDLYKDLLRKPNDQKQTPLDCAIEQGHQAAFDEAFAQYRQIRSTELPFDEQAGREAIQLFRQKLPDSKAQPYFKVVEKLFQVGDRDPSKSSLFGKSVIEKLYLKFGFRGQHRPTFIPEADPQLDFSLFLIKSFVEPHLKELFKRPQYATTLCTGLHAKKGRKSLFMQLQHNPLFDQNVLRLPLQLAGASKKPTTFSFFRSNSSQRDDYLGLNPILPSESPGPAIK